MPILIVAPTSVLTNWQREFNTWGAFQVALCHGKQETRGAMLRGIADGQYEILITSYDTFRYATPGHINLCPFFTKPALSCLTGLTAFWARLLHSASPSPEL